ncbi:MAG: rhomboid family intramembrane serine protease [Ginsengibacter sp.]
MSLTIILIAATVLVSILGFTNAKTREELIFSPALIYQENQYYRFVSYGFLHADIMHLIFNMYAFYLFGEATEYYFNEIFGQFGATFYLLLYFLSLIVCVIPDFSKFKNNPNYRSLGASGAVSAVVFAYIMFNPLQGIGLLFIPIFIPGFLFGILFLVISYFLGKKGASVVNHSAHIWGAIFGIIFIIIATEFFSDYPLLDNFINSVKNMNPKDIFKTR